LGRAAVAYRGEHHVKGIQILGLVAVLVLVAAACGDDDGGGTETAGTEAPSSDTSEPTETTAAGDPLGEPNPAEGEPVLVGLMGTGGDCPDCTLGGAIEEPVSEATIAWANEYLGGLGGRPMELVVCNNDLDPAKSVDCANEMIAQDVAAVVMGADSTVTGWEVLHEAGIPVINHSTTQESMIEDEDSTFILQGSEALTVEYPIGAALEVGADKVSIIVVDLPAATDIYTDETLQKFEDEGLEVDIIPVAIGTPDMTPQAQQIVQDNPDGLVNIVGHDAFCIPAIQGLQAAGFTGSIATISFCVTDAMREAIPGDAVEGMLLGASDALADTSSPSTVQYNAVLDEYATEDVARDSSSGSAIFGAFSALALGTAGLEGEVTPESVIDAMRSMDNAVLPGSGGRQFRCNGNAEAHVSVCMNSGLSATLDAEGRPVSYAVFNDEPIPD
jgi:branched-chain amino acid transport system substrate-binding protein